jgi:peptidoglycan/xylan/chitin deacetylase (PgdA/CDA1 family)
MALTINHSRAALALRGALPAVVLMYHRVADPVNDPWGLCVSPDHFTEQLEVLRRLVRPVTLAEAAAGPAAGAARVAVTFDDGYLDVHANAVPALEAAEIPATLFVVSGTVGARQEFWWDQLEQCFRAGWSGARHVELVAGEVRAAGTMTSDEPAMRRLHQVIYRLAPALIPGVMADLRRQVGAPAPVLERRPVTPAELAELAASPVMEVGAHTRNHANLTTLTADDRHDEIAGSRARLHTVLDLPIETISYPYGAHDGDTVRCARETGFTHACTVSPGTVTAGTDPLALPRMDVEDWDGDTFERRLRGWLAAA